MIDNNSFYFLCLEKRQPAYKLITSQLEYKMIYIDTLEELIKKCVEAPPTGLFIDILTSLRFGASNIMPIDNLGMCWPVMRCNITSNGSTLVLCMDTPKRDTLQNAMKALSNGEEGWSNPHNERQYIRMKIKYRTKIKDKNSNDGTWIEANGRNISAVGTFVHTYDIFPNGTTLEIELHDIFENPVKAECTVLWSRQWSDSTSLPGMGVAFNQKTIGKEIERILTLPENIRLFLSGKL